jgi:flavin reductase (DIM6/NTAB) family NADH-FMN oxidoreductase RutF
VPTPSEGPIGPFPSDLDPGDYDKQRRRILWKMPSGLYLLGSRAGADRNLMTINWVTQVSFQPKLVAVSVERTARTHELIDQGRVFSLNLIDRDDRSLVRKFVKPAELGEGSTLNGVAFHDGPSGAPVVDQAVAWLDCEVRQEVHLGGHTLFVGEVIDARFGG